MPRLLFIPEGVHTADGRRICLRGIEKSAWRIALQRGPMSKLVDRMESVAMQRCHVKENERQQDDRRNALPEKTRRIAVMMLFPGQRDSFTQKKAESVTNMHDKWQENEDHFNDQQCCAVAMNERENGLITIRPETEQADAEMNEQINTKDKSRERMVTTRATTATASVLDIGVRIMTVTATSTAATLFAVASATLGFIRRKNGERNAT